MKPEELLELYKLSLNDGDSRTQLYGMLLTGQHVDGYDLRCVDWGHSNFAETVFDNCDFRGSDFSDAIMPRAKLINCRIFDCKFPKDPSIQFIDCDVNLYS